MSSSKSKQRSSEVEESVDMDTDIPSDTKQIVMETHHAVIHRPSTKLRRVQISSPKIQNKGMGQNMPQAGRGQPHGHTHSRALASA